MNKELIPCNENVYEYFLNNDVEQIDSKSSSELRHFASMLDENFSVCSKTIYKYDVVSRKDLLRSVGNVTHIVLEITEQCNLCCVYCCYGRLFKKSQHGKFGEKKAIIGYLKTFLSVRNKFENKAPLRITFYGGEALLRFDIITECVDLAKSMLPNTELSFGMTTNGMLLDKYIDYLVENKFYILVSIDGNKKNDSYRLTKRNEESFEIVERNIDCLFNKYPEYFNKYVDFNSVLHNRNTYLEAMAYLSRWGKIPSFSPMSVSGGKKKFRNLLKKISKQNSVSDDDMHDFELKYPQIDLKKIVGGKTKSWFWGNGEKFDILTFSSLTKEDKCIYPGGTCRLFQNRVFVTVDGDLLPCERISRKFKFGKVHQNGISFYTKRINQYYCDIQNRFISKCSSCYRSYICNKCFFSDIEEIESGVCHCDKEQAIKKFYYNL